MPNIDRYLEVLAKNVQRSQTTSHIILHVEGLLIGGELVSSQEFARISVFAPEGSSDAEKLRWKEDLDQELERLNHESIETAIEILSLKNVLIFGGKSTLRTGIWRVRLDAVSGWCLGSLPDDV